MLRILMLIGSTIFAFWHVGMQLDFRLIIPIVVGWYLVDLCLGIAHIFIMDQDSLANIKH